MVIKAHAGRDDINQGKAFMFNPGLNQRDKLGFIAGETARDKGGADRQGEGARINRLHDIDFTLFGRRARIRSGRELSLSQAVNAIIFQHIKHIYITAHRMDHLSRANREAIAIARHANIGHMRIARHCACGDAGHTSVNRIIAVRLFHEIGCRFG